MRVLKRKNSSRYLAMLLVWLTLFPSVLTVFGEGETPETPEGHFAVEFVDFDGTSIKGFDVAKDTVIKAEDLPQTPTREDYEFTGWTPDVTAPITADTTFTAQYKLLEQYTVTINYLYDDGEIAAVPYSAKLVGGDSLKKSVQSPVIAGYTPSYATMELDISDIRENKSYDVVYASSGSVFYTVEHRLQNIDGLGYTVADTERLAGATGSEAVITLRNYEGFSIPAELHTVRIAADGSTVVQVDYTRNFYTMVFNSLGSSVEPLVLRYGQAVTQPSDPTRPGYSFVNWVDESGAEFNFTGFHMPAHNVELKATWQSQSSNYTLVYWLQNADDDEYSYVTQVTKSGVTGGAPEITAADKETIPTMVCKKCGCEKCGMTECKCTDCTGGICDCENAPAINVNKVYFMSAESVAPVKIAIVAPACAKVSIAKSIKLLSGINLKIKRMGRLSRVTIAPL